MNRIMLLSERSVQSEAPHDRPVVRSCCVKMMVLVRVICSLFLQGLSPSYTSMLCLLT